MKLHQAIQQKVTLGKKGQLTIPKIIRDQAHLHEDDTFMLSQTPGGDIIIRKIKDVEAPEEKLLQLLEKLPKFDFKKAWAEVVEERRNSHR